MIVADLLGMFEAFTPKFVKKYANLADDIKQAFAEYIKEVKSGAFPGPEHAYNMREGELQRFEEIKDQL